MFFYSRLLHCCLRRLTSVARHHHCMSRHLLNYSHTKHWKKRVCFGWCDGGEGKGREQLTGEVGEDREWEIMGDRGEGRGWEREREPCHRPQRLSSLLTSMCHLTVLQIRLHMLPEDVRTYILMAGWNLHRCSGVIFYLTRLSAITTRNPDSLINCKFYLNYVHVKKQKSEGREITFEEKIFKALHSHVGNYLLRVWIVT